MTQLHFATSLVSYNDNINMNYINLKLVCSYRYNEHLCIYIHWLLVVISHYYDLLESLVSY